MSNYIEKITIGDNEYAIRDKETGALAAANAFRMDAIEKHLDVGNDFVVVEGEHDVLTIPASVHRYAKVTALASNMYDNAYYDGFATQAPIAILMLDDGENVLKTYSVPYAQLPDYGYGVYGGGIHERNNYIFFEGGRAYYHHGAYFVAGEDTPPENEGDFVLETQEEGTVYAYAVPEIIDVSDILDFDGFIDLQGVSLIKILPLYQNGDYFENNEMHYAYVKIAFEKR